MTIAEKLIIIAPTFFAVKNSPPTFIPMTAMYIRKKPENSPLLSFKETLKFFLYNTAPKATKHKVIVTYKYLESLLPDIATKIKANIKKSNNLTFLKNLLIAYLLEDTKNYLASNFVFHNIILYQFHFEINIGIPNIPIANDAFI